MTDIEIGYLAGILDGEGCIYVNRRKIHGRRKTPGYGVKIVVSITSFALVEWFIEHAFLTSIYHCHPKGNRKDKWTCTWNNSKAEWFIETVIEHLVIKQRQAILGLELLRHLRTTPVKSRVCISPDVIAYREDIKQQISALNWRGRPVQ